MSVPYNKEDSEVKKILNGKGDKACISKINFSIIFLI